MRMGSKEKNIQNKLKFSSTLSSWSTTKFESNSALKKKKRRKKKNESHVQELRMKIILIVRT